MTPVGIAFLKGHMGLIDVLLEQPSVDINFRDDQGMTLVGIACATPLDRSICDQIKYLVEDKNADCTLSDVNKSTPVSAYLVFLLPSFQYHIYLTIIFLIISTVASCG